jgi:hypothetical protein
MRELVSLLVLLTGTVPISVGAEDRHSPIFVEAEPSVIARTTLPLLGFRASSESFVSGKFVIGESADSTAYYIPEEIIKSSVRRNPSFVKFFSENGISDNELSPMNLKLVAGRELGAENNLYEDGLDSIDFLTTSMGSPAWGMAEFDATAVNNMIRAGVLNFDESRTAQIGRESITVIPLKAEYQDSVRHAYDAAVKVGQHPLSDLTVEWKNPTAAFDVAAARYPLDKLLAVRLGDVSFGNPWIRKPSDAGLEIEPSTAEKYDIYLIRWGVTFRDLPIPEIAELSFRVEFPDECQAMELAPFRVATAEKTTISYGIPTITVRGVSVGDVFNKQIVYASLKPKIVAMEFRKLNSHGLCRGMRFLLVPMYSLPRWGVREGQHLS